MSAAKRVAHAAETVRARWEQQVSTDPQTEAAQALEDTGQLLDPEVAAELVAFRKERELAEAVAEYGAFPVPVGPAPRTLDVVEDELTGVNLSLYEEELTSERLRWALASAKRGRARLRARVAELLAERRTTNEALDDVVRELRARQTPCPCPSADQPGPHQFGCPLAEVPIAATLPVPESCRLDADGLDEVSQRFIGGAS